MPDTTRRRRRRRKVTLGDPSRVIAYMRVSTVAQGESGLGLHAQRDAIAAYCAQRNLTVAWREETRSAKSLHLRRELLAAIAAIRRGEAGGLIVDKVDRLGRNLHDVAGIVRTAREEGWRLIALDVGAGLSLDTANTAAADLVVHMLALAAEFERARHSERQRAKFEVLRQQGKLRGHAAAPRRLADRLRAQRAAGMTWQSIADELNAKRVPQPQGGQKGWFPATVRNVTITRERELAARKRKEVA
jgi:DNA invertase Pin-like site-specific DNA recombinase